MTDFSGFGLTKPILRAIKDEGYTAPTPIQAKAIPPLLQNRDLIGVAQTGTGKTAAFALPALQRLSRIEGRTQRRSARILVLAPTRELAVQINDCFRSYGRHMRVNSTVVLGGTPIGKQIRALSNGVDALIATPGRLLDLIRQGHVRLDLTEILVLDEADRMLDMGFVHDVKKIASMVAKNHQTVLFSATMPPAVQQLANGLLKDPVKVEVAQQSTTAERVVQKVLFVAKDKKRALLADLMTDSAIKRVLIFTRTKHGADKVARHLEGEGIQTGVIHGNKSQNARQRALNGFRNGRVRALVATDIAARGIDVDGVTHVINYELPNEPEGYVHRIGRTARAGTDGIAISFCDLEERGYLIDIEKTIRQSVPVDTDHAYHAPEIANDNGKTHRPKRGGGNRSHGGGRGNGGPRGNGDGRGKSERGGERSASGYAGRKQGNGKPRRSKPRRAPRTAA